MIYIAMILVAVCRVIDQKYRISDRKGKLNTKWKKWTAAIIFIMWLAYVFKGAFLPDDKIDCLLAGSLFWLISELGINKFALNEKWLYVGKDGSFPDNLGNGKWLLLFGLPLVFTALKIFL